MKTREIIEQAQISRGLTLEKQPRFFAIMAQELERIYKEFNQEDSERHFTAALKMLRSKWDGVSNKIRYGIKDGVWDFFFAVEVVRLKKDLLPTWRAKQDEEHQKYLQRQQRRREQQERVFERYDEE